MITEEIFVRNAAGATARMWDGFLDRALAPTIAFSNRRLEGLARSLSYFKTNVARFGMQRPFLATSPGILPSLAAKALYLAGRAHHPR